MVGWVKETLGKVLDFFLGAIVELLVLDVILVVLDVLLVLDILLVLDVLLLVLNVLLVLDVLLMLDELVLVLNVLLLLVLLLVLDVLLLVVLLMLVVGVEVEGREGVKGRLVFNVLLLVVLLVLVVGVEVEGREGVKGRCEPEINLSVSSSELQQKKIFFIFQSDKLQKEDYTFIIRHGRKERFTFYFNIISTLQSKK